MESLQNVLELIRPGVYMASIDLKDAFYSGSQKPPSLRDIFCRMFEICIYAKQIWTIHANI